MRFAVDTGGTFTDLLVEHDDGRLSMHKASTTPEDPIAGVVGSLRLAAEAQGVALSDLLGRGTLFVHGTTRAINAIVTGATARTAFLTTAGHPDILVLREGGRRDVFDFTVPYPDPYVPRSLTWEVPERIMADGSVLTPLDEAAVIASIEDMKAADIEAVAVCLLWSIVEPAHELRVGELLAEHMPGVPVTLSHQANPSLREYRRASSTAIDASLKPLMSALHGRSDGQAAGRGLWRPGAHRHLERGRHRCRRRGEGADPPDQLRPRDGARGGTAFRPGRRRRGNRDRG